MSRIRRFLQLESTGGVLLLTAAVIALIWANSPWSGAYEAILHYEVTLGTDALKPSLDVLHWINDGLMTLFFFVVAIEIKQEFVGGRLSRPADAAIPVVAALCGMIVPAAIYFAINVGGAGQSGWGIPMATDIAFALGVLVLLGDRVPEGLKVLLLALAIVDDIGAIAVIAAFYSSGIHGWWLLTATCGLAVVLAMRKLRVRRLLLYVVVGIGIWFATYRSGVHATLAGVAVGLLVPASAERRDQKAGGIGVRIRDSLHPWTSLAIVPIFALANSGVRISSDLIADAAKSRITVGIVFGLVIGKLIGVTAAITGMTRWSSASLPEGIGGAHLAGLGTVAGIGFTVSLFVADLAFDEAALEAQAKLGILVASALAAILTVILLRFMPSGQRSVEAHQSDAAG